MIELELVHSPSATPGPHDRTCTFCRRPLAKVDLLVRGPGVSICSHCIEQCVASLRRHRVEGFRAWWDPRPTVSSARHRGNDGACSFCLKPELEDAIVAEHGRICPPCVLLCVQMFAEQRARKR